MNSIYRKYFVAVIIVLLLLISLSNYYSVQGIDNLAYVIAIGLDSGENEKLKLTLQIAKPSNSSDSGGGSSQSSSSVVTTIECSSINSGITLFDSILGKRTNLSHCKILVISEELAAKGTSEYIYTLTNNIEFHADANIVISKCSAEEFLGNSVPLLDELSARYYEIAPANSEATGYTESVTFEKFYTALSDTTKEAVAILGTINTPATQTTKSDSSYIAGQTPVKSKDSPNNLEAMGIALFSGDKFVGSLTSLECLMHLIVSDKLKTASIQIPSPLETLDKIDLYIKSNHVTKKKVDIINGSPYIDCKIQIDAKMVSMDKQVNLTDPNIVKQIEDYANSYLESLITQYLYKTSKDYHTDIDGFGKTALKHFTTLSEWNDYNWLHRYKDAIFSVDVNVNLKSSYLLIDT